MAAREREQRRKARERAEAREERRTRGRLRRRIRRFLVGGIIGFGGLMVVLSLVLPNSLTNGRGVNSAEQGVQVPIQGNERIEVGQVHPAYTTFPPTSGWHYDIPLEEITWGAQEVPLANEAQVSYLERGGIMVQYKCPDGCPDLQQQLKRVVNRYPEGVILAPYLDMDTTIALTSWGWRDAFEDFDDPRIDDFIQRHIGRGPESFR